MARFLMSPGVHVREIDQSQYAATAPTGNVAALIGYAEKGPFEPTIVAGEQDFVQRFGKTLEDAPYLSQTAKKYFAQGSSLLVVRAGDNRDPELYPQAAQYASKTIRIDSSVAQATRGYQEFSKVGDLSPGTFAPSTTFEADVIADHRAFAEPKHMETWSADLNFTNVNGASVDWSSQPTDFSGAEAKIAMTKETDNSFEIDYKSVHVGENNYGRYYGTGTRSGKTSGSTVSAMVELYHRNSDYTAEGTDGSDNIQLSGTYQAVALGTTPFTSGVDWVASPSEFRVTLDNVEYIVSLTETTTTPIEMTSHINSQLASVETADGQTGVDISGRVTAFLTSNSAGEAFVCLRHAADDSADRMQMGANDFGWYTMNPLLDSDFVYGTWRSEDYTGAFYEGTIILKKENTEENAYSFVEPLTVQVTSPSTGSWTLNDIASQIETSLTNGWDAYPNSEARASALPHEETGRIRITTDMTPEDGRRARVMISSSGGNSLIDLLEGLEGGVVGVPSHSEGNALITLRAAEKGTYGNKLALRVSTTEIQKAPGEVEHLYNVFVLLDGKEVSGYQRVNWENPNASNYLPMLLEEDAYLKMDAEDEDGNSTLAKLPDGTWTLADDQPAEGVSDPNLEIVDYTPGTDGFVTDENGTIESMDSDFIKALEKIYNPEVYNFNLVAAPGLSGSEQGASPAQLKVLDLCESRRDCFGLIDAGYFGLGLGVKNNINHVSEVNNAVSNINSSYVGVYWPWLQDYDADNKQYIWLPPSAYALAQMVYTDNVADPWFATAGLRRGKVTALDVEYSPTRSDRDLLYGDTNIVNPIVSLVGEGIAIWGQKTGQRTKSATDRINVRRLLIYAEKLIANMARGFLFEPNDPANWSAFARQANGILEPIRQRRGLYQYQVICDESTNPPELVNQNTMAGKIFLQPMKTIEFVEVSFTITAYGVEFEEG